MITPSICSSSLKGRYNGPSLASASTNDPNHLKICGALGNLVPRMTCLHGEHPDHTSLLDQFHLGILVIGKKIQKWMKKDYNPEMN